MKNLLLMAGLLGWFLSFPCQSLAKTGYLVILTNGEERLYQRVEVSNVTVAYLENAGSIIYNNKEVKEVKTVDCDQVQKAQQEKDEQAQKIQQEKDNQAFAEGIARYAEQAPERERAREREQAEARNQSLEKEMEQQREQRDRAEKTARREREQGQALVTMSVLMSVFMSSILMLYFLYFLPTLVGLSKRNSTAIFALNLLLGWTFLGWVVALVWALTHDTVGDTK